jgi:cell division protein FtsQ
MSVTVPADKRFLRNPVQVPRRRRPRSGLTFRIARIVVAVVVLVGGGYWTARASGEWQWLRVQRLTVSGNQRVQVSEILARLDGLKGESLLGADLDRWRARLLASPWVADATLRRRLPATIDVEIRERKALGVARIRHELLLVDGIGTIDEFGPRYADLDLPVIDGLVVDAGSPRPRVDAARAETVGRLMADLRAMPALAKRVSQIDVTDAHDVHVILAGDSAVIRLGDAQFAERLQSYVDLQATLRQRVPEIDYVDLRFGERVYVGPAHGTPAAAPGATAGSSAIRPPRDAAARHQP